MTRRKLPEPRWRTPMPPGVVGSWGPDVTRWAEAELGMRMDRWQQLVLNRALAVVIRTTPALSLPGRAVIRAGDTPGLAHRHYLASTARQQGKTVGVRALLGWALTNQDGPPWATILGLAHDAAQARIPYKAVLIDLEAIRRRFPRGGLRLTRYLGIRSDLYGRHREYTTGSKEARDAIRSLSVDLGVFDEVRTQRTYDTWAALEPTTRARPDPLIFGISTAGDDRSLLLRDWWDRGRRIIDGAEPADGFGMTWYAADDDDTPTDPRAVLKANPAVAEGRVPLAPVLASVRTLTSAAYRQETLNLWSEGADEWLPPGTWPARLGPQPAQAMRVILGAEATPTWRRVTVTVAILTDAGAWVGVAGELDSARSDRSTIAPEQLTRLVGELARTWRPSGIAYSAAAAAAPHLKAWAEQAKVPAIELGPRQIRAASQLFRSELIGARLTHGPDPLLASQVRVARPSAPIEGGDWYFSIRDSIGEIDGLRAAAWAAWAAIAPPERTVAPQVF
jgi:hypothetical protein